LVDAGIPWQDARRVMWMGTQTYIHDQYNYLALQGVLANRLEHIMDWEFNCVAQLMLREVKMQCPPLFSKYLGSHSDKAKAAKFAGLESWPPDGKWPVPDAVKDLPRQHTAEQMPFFVLHPSSMAGGPIKWIVTNGTYPHEEVKNSGEKT
jgi:thymidylate synthase ThyX